MVLLVTLEKIAILVPPKLSSELELRSTFLGQFWRYSDGIFSKVTRRTVAFNPIIPRSPQHNASKSEALFCVLCT